MVLFVYDKAVLDEEDIAAAQLLVFGKAREPLIRRVGARVFLSPGPIGCPTGGAAVLDDGADGIRIEILGPGGVVTAQDKIGGPRPGKMRVQGGAARWASATPRVAVFGGSFNPPHVGHVLGVVYALSTAPIDEVLVVPVYQHPFAKDLAPFADRLAMCRLAFGWLPRVTVSTVEEELGGESRTLRTVEHLRADHPARLAAPPGRRRRARRPPQVAPLGPHRRARARRW